MVQIYVTLPQTELEKEYKRLAGFAKTRLLKPGETQTLTVEIPQKQLASFNEETHTWIVEKRQIWHSGRKQFRQTETGSSSGSFR